MVIWIIGLSGSGKTTIGRELAKKLREYGRKLVFMDGDILRKIMGNDLGHTIEDRRKNADRVCRLCQHLNDSGIDVIFSILSLFSESREWNRQNIAQYFEIYLKASLDAVKRRDPKGLYKKEFSGEIRNVAGIDIPFKEPENPDLIIENSDDRVNFDDMVTNIVDKLKTKKLI